MATDGKKIDDLIIQRWDELLAQKEVIRRKLLKEKTSKGHFEISTLQEYQDAINREKQFFEQKVIGN
jgi:hypothetical protein